MSVCIYIYINMQRRSIRYCALIGEQRRGRWMDGWMKETPYLMVCICLSPSPSASLLFSSLLFASLLFSSLFFYVLHVQTHTYTERERERAREQESERARASARVRSPFAAPISSRGRASQDQDAVVDEFWIICTSSVCVCVPRPPPAPPAK